MVLLRRAVELDDGEEYNCDGAWNGAEASGRFNTSDAGPAGVELVGSAMVRSALPVTGGSAVIVTPLPRVMWEATFAPVLKTTSFPIALTCAGVPEAGPVIPFAPKNTFPGGVSDVFTRPEAVPVT